MYQSEVINPNEVDEFERLLDASSLRAHTASPASPEVPADVARRVVERAKAVAHRRYAVGVELLSYRLVGVVVDEDGQRLADDQVVLDDMGVRSVVDAVASLVDSLVRTVPEGSPVHERVRVGLQLGGPVDAATGTVLFYRKVPPDPVRVGRVITWEDHQPLGRLLATATGLPTVVENDSNAYAVYQQWFRAGRRVPRFAVVLIREGVGAALVVNNALFDAPMELGNLPVFPEGGRRCDCGSLGCLETTGGIYGILDTVYTYTGARVESVAAAAELAERPDIGPKVSDAFAAAGRANARGIGYLVNLVRPERLVLCAPAVMVDPRYAAARAFRTELETFGRYCHTVFRQTELVVEPLRPYDGAHGAALVALDRFFGIRSPHVAERPR